LVTQHDPFHAYISYAATEYGCRTIDAQRTSNASAVISAASRGRTRFSDAVTPDALTSA